MNDQLYKDRKLQVRELGSDQVNLFFVVHKRIRESLVKFFYLTKQIMKPNKANPITYEHGSFDGFKTDIRVKSFALLAILFLSISYESALAAVCYGEELPESLGNPSSDFTNAFLDGSNTHITDVILTEGQDGNTSTVVGGRLSRVLIDPATLPPEPGSETTGLGPNSLAPDQTGKTVSQITDDANDAFNISRPTDPDDSTKYAKPRGAAFIIGHLLNGDYYGNTGSNHTNFVTLTTFSNGFHKKIEGFTKKLFARFYRKYYDPANFGNSRQFFAFENNNTNVTYLPVVDIKVEASTSSIFDAVQGGQHEGLQFNGDASNLATFDEIEKALPEKITQTVSVYMRKYNRSGPTWVATEEIKVIPEETWNSIFETKNANDPSKRRYVVLGDVQTPTGSPISYNYVQGVGPTFSMVVDNVGPFKEFINN